jgi:hypothetical protein
VAEGWLHGAGADGATGRSVAAISGGVGVAAAEAALAATLVLAGTVVCTSAAGGVRAGPFGAGCHQRTASVASSPTVTLAAATPPSVRARERRDPVAR